MLEGNNGQLVCPGAEGTALYPEIPQRGSFHFLRNQHNQSKPNTAVKMMSHRKSTKVTYFMTCRAREKDFCFFIPSRPRQKLPNYYLLPFYLLTKKTHQIRQTYGVPSILGFQFSRSTSQFCKQNPRLTTV